MHWKNEQYWLDNSSHAHILADVPESNGETLRMQYAVPPTVTQGLYRICRKNDALIFSFLYAVLTILLNEVSIEERIVTLMLKKEKGEIVGAPVCTPFSNGTIKNFIVQFNKYLQNALIHMISIKNLSCEDMIYQISFGSISDCEIPCRISDLHVSYKVFGEELIVTFTCKTNSFSSSFLSALIKSYGKLLYQTVVSPDTMLSAIELCSSEDKEQILHHFNKPINSQSSSFRELIERPFLKGAGRLAVTQAIHWKTAMQEYDDHAYARQFFLRSHFSANRFAHVFSHKSYIKAISEMEMIDGWKLMKTNAGNSILINRTGICFIKMVERYHTVYQVQKHLDEIHGLLDLYDLGNMENFKKDSVKRFNIDIKKDDGLIRTIKKLLDLNILVYGTNRIKPAYLTEEGLEYHISDSKETKEELGKTDILLLGDSTGTSSVGILYLASYLHRMGVRVKCQLNHSRFWPLEKHIQNLLARFRPKFVGISMKWFPHMERVETICRLIKSIRPDIKIVLGGNTASQFYTSLIQKDYVDYIIRGDGELPLSELCLGASYIHNAVYKKKGQIVVNPIEYIQDQATSDVYLSNLEDILITPDHLLYMDSAYIYIGKGCSQRCIYCAGHSSVQKQLFSRAKPFIRSIELIRKDIQLLKPYIGTFLFDFDLIESNTYQLFKKVFDGLDLNKHLCKFYIWKIPDAKFIKLVSETFCHISLNLDVPCLSERMRRQLSEKWNIKCLFSNKDLLNFMDSCEQYENIEVKISTIGGLHHDSDAFAEEYALIDALYSDYTCFRGLDWETLHAQPGAPILKTCEKMDMYAEADDYDSFLSFSRRNQVREIYPKLENLFYPAIRFNNDTYNDKVRTHFTNILNLQQSYIERQDQLKRRYTYRELDQYADILACELRKRGATGYVAIYMEKCIEYVASILAVLKAGCAYIPLVESMSESQILSILQSSGCTTVLSFCTHTLRAKKWPVSLIDITNIYMDDSENMVNGNGQSTDIVTKTAYMIFTSGSTGEPKGVPIKKEGLANLQNVFHDILHVQRNDRIALFASMSFDASVWEMFMALFNSASLILLNDDDIHNTNVFVRVINENRVTIVTLPPHYLNLLDPSQFHTLKKVIVAGASPNDRTLLKWEEKLEVYNAYGPTEATVCASIGRYDSTLNPHVHIGSPISNTKIIVLNRKRKLCPVNVFGDIYISGQGLTEGYINDPAFFKEQTTMHIFGEDIWYKSGDIGRFLDDGRLEIWGRNDRRVKVNGYRVELEKIERILNQQPQILNSAIIVWNAGNGNSQSLVAFVEAKDRIDTREMQKSLRAYLAKYEIPESIIIIDSLPKNANNKIDYKKLEMQLGNIMRNECNTEWKTDLEKTIAGIWSEILEQPVRSGKFNFFENGGNSLLAIQMISEIENKMDIQIRITDLFVYPVFDEFIQFLGQKVDRLVDENEGCTIVVDPYGSNDAGK